MWQRLTLLKYAISPSIVPCHHTKSSCAPEKYQTIYYERRIIEPCAICSFDSNKFTLLDPFASKVCNDSTKCSSLSSTFVDRKSQHCRFNCNEERKSFRHNICSATDVSMRPMQFLLQNQLLLANNIIPKHNGNKHHSTCILSSAIDHHGNDDAVATYGEQLEELECRWGKKFYGQVTFGPRNFPYPSSRWLARRYQMKKHRTLKRYRFRRYKLAAVANLPFSKMIRVGMLPELKSSKTKAGDAMDAALTSQLVGVAKSNVGEKSKGRRSRPKSKYQV